MGISLELPATEALPPPELTVDRVQGFKGSNRCATTPYVPSVESEVRRGVPRSPSPRGDRGSLLIHDVDLRAEPEVPDVFPL